MAKSRTSFNIPEDLLQRSRDTVAFLGGPPLYLTLAKLAEDALEAEIKRLQDEFNKGKPFPRFTGRVKTGRPVGS